MAYAQGQEKPAKKTRPTAEEAFKKWNKAGDGKLTLPEYLVHKRNNKEKAEAAFKAADKDSKGYLTLDEFKTIYGEKLAKKPRPTAEETFKKWNKAGDGKLTLAEYSAHKRDKAKAEATFKAADKDSKGYLTLDEFKTIYGEAGQKAGRRKGPGKSPRQSSGKERREGVQGGRQGQQGLLDPRRVQDDLPAAANAHRKHGGDQVPEKSPELPAEKAADKAPESK